MSATPWFCVLLHLAVALCFTVCKVCTVMVIVEIWGFFASLAPPNSLMSALVWEGCAGAGGGSLCCRSFVLCPEQRLFQVLYDQNGALRRELQRLHLQLQESRAEGGLPAAGNMQEGSVPILSARTKFPLDPSLHGGVGRIVVSELLLPVLVLGSHGREEGEHGWWGGGRWRRGGFSS